MYVCMAWFIEKNGGCWRTKAQGVTPQVEVIGLTGAGWEDTAGWTAKGHTAQADL